MLVRKHTCGKHFSNQQAARPDRKAAREKEKKKRFLPPLEVLTQTNSVNLLQASEVHLRLQKCVALGRESIWEASGVVCYFKACGPREPQLEGGFIST